MGQIADWLPELDEELLELEEELLELEEELLELDEALELDEELLELEAVVEPLPPQAEKMTVQNKTPISFKFIVEMPSYDLQSRIREKCATDLNGFHNNY